MVEGLLIEIQQCELTILAKFVFREEVLNFTRRATTQIEDPRGLAQALRSGGFLGEFLVENFEPVPMSLSRQLLQKPRINDLRKQRRTLIRVARDHIYHLVVAGVAEGLPK